ncbi:Bro-N domain-containing protein [Patescibacteria group bacterium]|nr:Bro-N domain-containing protein [Patescibacteria group bacterium]
MKNDDPGMVLFENFLIRRYFDEKKEKWYFSVVDVVRALIQQGDFQTARKYWNKLKERLVKEGSEVVTNCHRLPMLAADGKMRETDAADVETLLRLIQSVPSPKAEPIKLWLAKVGYERMQEMSDPEKSIGRARKNWEKLGRTKEWIQRRMMGQETRNKLTDYWSGHGVKEGKEFAILTDIIHEEWAEIGVKEHKNLKGLKRQNLRDHMTEAELLFTALAEMSSRQIAEVDKADGLVENKDAGKKGGVIARNAKKELEKRTGKKVVSGNNYLGDEERNKRLES